MEMVGNGQKNPLTIFTYISFCSIGIGKRKVGNGLRALNSGNIKNG
jgi:hypothetical protein